MAAKLLVVTDDTTREDLITALTSLCAEAKALSRRGCVGTATPAYAHRHEQIDAVLSDLLAAR